MNLIESYKKIKSTIVAFTPLFHPVYDKNEIPPEFPSIIGTGFIMDEGIVVTNDHVVKAFSKLPKPKDSPPDLWPVQCILLYYVPDKGMLTIKLDVLGVLTITHMDQGKVYYGPAKPDIAFVHVKMKGLPKANIKYNLEEINEGREVATAGFPMGTETLMAPGYLHQLTPTLQKGIISAVLPFPCSNPHALMINVMVQGGASGSPVFLPETSDVIGVLYGGLNEIRNTISTLSKDIKNGIKKLEPSIHSHFFNAPTNISYIVPAHYIEKLIGKIKIRSDFKLSDDTPYLEEYIKEGILVERKRGDPYTSTIWKGPEMLQRKIKKEKLSKD